MCQTYAILTASGRKPTGKKAGKNRKGANMEEMNTAELLVEQTRKATLQEVLRILEHSEDVKQAAEKVEALLK